MFRALCGLWLSCALAAAADSALLQYAPPQTGVLIGINLKQLKASEFGQAALAQMAARQPAGFDPLREAEEVLMALPVKAGNGRGLFLVRGGPCRPSNAKQWAGRAGANEVAVACLGPALLAAGDPATVRALATRTGGADPELLARAREIASSNDLWLVARTALEEFAGELPFATAAPGELAAGLLKSVRQVSAGVKLSPSLLFTADLGTANENDAAGLASALRLLSAMAPKEGAGEALGPLLSKLEIRPEGRAVKLSLAVTKDELARLGRGVVGGMKVKPPDAGVTVYSSPKDMGVVKVR